MVSSLMMHGADSRFAPNPTSTWAICGALSPADRVATDPAKVSCRFCKKNPRWKAFAEAASASAAS